MNCYLCQTELIWGGDHDYEYSDDFCIVSNLFCPKCNSYVEVFWPSEDNKECKEEETGKENINSKRNEGIPKVN